MTEAEMTTALCDLLYSIWWADAYDMEDIEAEEIIDWINDPYGGLTDDEALWLAWNALTGDTP